MIETKKGCVYFFRHLGLKPVKIGFSSDETPHKRFNSFKTYAPFGAELLGFIRTVNPMGVEGRLHKKFDNRRLEGEWFDISLEEVEFEIKHNTTHQELIERSIFWEEFSKKNTSITKNNNLFDNGFLTFISDFIQGNISICRTELKYRYVKETKANITSQEFYKKIREYCRVNLIVLNEKKFNGLVHFHFFIK